MNEVPFVLPVGLSTPDGHVHRAGTMRLATAWDEIEPVGDERVKHNEAYFGLLVLTRVIPRLGPFAPVTPEVIAALPAADYAYLQDLYASLNDGTRESSSLSGALLQAPGNQPPTRIETECPHCGALLEVDLGLVSP